MGIIVVVTGGRNHEDRQRVFASLDCVHNQFTIDLMVQGGCQTGADLFARQWATAAGVDCRTYAANWGAHGKAAGPIRNARMVEDSKADVVLAFPGGAGTADCVRKAQAAGIPVNPTMLALGARILARSSDGSV